MDISKIDWDKVETEKYSELLKDYDNLLFEDYSFLDDELDEDLDENLETVGCQIGQSDDN